LFKESKDEKSNNDDQKQEERDDELHLYDIDEILKCVLQSPSIQEFGTRDDFELETRDDFEDLEDVIDLIETTVITTATTSKQHHHGPSQERCRTLRTRRKVDKKR
jgi:hypothetical protein